ncbi:hypothetical protein F0562_010648 [Nyssa sinensis]|uniref:Uncharacterized protein n=1 Tax=Nyssa sinensis TaxID=561372 RepID=A0A5J4ZZF4_9ASTE|nr:hypothetical protein F0562_010648 [Nyssa sinensis]
MENLCSRTQPTSPTLPISSLPSPYYRKTWTTPLFSLARSIANQILGLWTRLISCLFSLAPFLLSLLCTIGISPPQGQGVSEKELYVAQGQGVDQ